MARSRAKRRLRIGKRVYEKRFKENVKIGRTNFRLQKHSVKDWILGRIDVHRRALVIRRIQRFLLPPQIR